MLSYNYCNFEFESTIESDGGITKSDAENAREENMQLALDAIEEYKKTRPAVNNYSGSASVKSSLTRQV